MKINHLFLFGFLTISVVSMYFIVKHIRKTYAFLKSGFRTTATVCEVLDHTSSYNMELGYVPVIEFKSHHGVVRRMKSKFFSERFTEDPKLKVGYQFRIIYDRKDINSMVELATVRAEIITYCVVGLFPGFFILFAFIDILF